MISLQLFAPKTLLCTPELSCRCNFSATLWCIPNVKETHRIATLALWQALGLSEAEWMAVKSPAWFGREDINAVPTGLATPTRECRQEFYQLAPTPVSAHSRCCL